MEDKILKILQGANLRNTKTRRLVLEAFLKSHYALGYNDLEQYTKGALDKVTIYRTLKSFQEKGLVHEVIDNGTLIKYSLCVNDCQESHQDNHVHFKCKQCANTYCLSHTTIPKIQIPEGYKVDSVELLVLGTCLNCRD